MSLFAPMRAELAGLTALRVFGRISGTRGAVLCASGFGAEGPGRARLGDRVRIALAGGGECHGEVLGIAPGLVEILPETEAEGVALGDPVELLGPVRLAPDAAWIGRVIDPLGQPLDGRPLARGAQMRPLRGAPPPAASRKRLGGRLGTGLDLFNTLLPIARGQRLGLFAGSGVGKTLLLGELARGVEAGVVVLALVGERGRELRDFLEDVLGAEGLSRAVVIVATSDQSPLLRRRAALAGLCIAEHFRAAGEQVLFLCDSVTRFAEAHREIALSAGEQPSLRGFPPSVAHQIMRLAERAGTGPEGEGDITALFTVLVAGSDMDEPVADILRGVLDGHVVLDRAIAERGRFPAVDVLRSVSRSLPAAATPGENQQISEARRLMGAWDRAEMMVQAGLHAPGADPLTDRAIRLWPRLDGFAAGRSASIAESFRRLASVLEP